MRIGCPKEIKNHEYRVGLTPASVREFTARGHEVIVQSGAGAAVGLDDPHYATAGAVLVRDAAEVFARAELIVKVKEPQPQECAMLRPGQILYTYLHLAPDPEQTAALIRSGAAMGLGCTVRYGLCCHRGLPLRPDLPADALPHRPGPDP
jgi:alanine dehydrogenase